MSRLLGGVLVGGRGRRMGGPKEGVVVQGRTLLARAWNAVAPAADGVVLQGTDSAPSGLQASPDRRSDAGPLAGLETLLLRALEDGRPGVVVLAVDLPRVGAPVMLDLVRRWRELDRPERSAVVGEVGDHHQALAGVYGTGLADELGGWLDSGGRAVQEWLPELGERLVRVPAAELAGVAGHVEPLLNVNRPEDRDRAEALPAPTPPMVSVSGWKDAGKTTVAVALVRSLRLRGHRVMALKHGHGFDLDREGTDSHRLRTEGGAERVMLAGPDELALMGEWGDRGEPGVTELAARHLAEAEVVVVEGWKGAPLPAVEVVGGGEKAGPRLWSAASPDRDRFLARVLREGDAAEDDGGPPILFATDPDFPERLAELVEEGVLPGWLP